MKKKITGIIALASVLAVLAVAASAQTNRQLRTNVPFDFNVAGTQLPAGNYIFTYGGAGISGSTVIIRSTDGRGAIAALVRTEVTAEPGEVNGVSFSQVDGKYYLNEISMYALRIVVGTPGASHTKLTVAAK